MYFAYIPINYIFYTQHFIFTVLFTTHYSAAFYKYFKIFPHVHVLFGLLNIFSSLSHISDKYRLQKVHLEKQKWVTLFLKKKNK